MKKEAAIVFMVILLLPSVSAYGGYNVSEGKHAEWEVTKYEVDAFLYIKEGSIIHAEVINSSNDAINVLLTSSDFVNEEPLIDYSDTRCFPFIVPISLLNGTEIVSDERKETLFGVERTIVTIITKNVKISNTITADFIMQYDKETGLMTEWKIVQSFGEKSFETIITLTNTDFWAAEKIGALQKFYGENKEWLVPSIILLIGVGVAAGIYYAVKPSKILLR